jgi:hypothetical protein
MSKIPFSLGATCDGNSTTPRSLEHLLWLPKVGKGKTPGRTYLKQTHLHFA